jgi:hypothetical protein
MKMHRILRLTSPYMRGPDVLAAQRVLNRFGAWAGTEDAIFGPTTAAAAKQAKWMLGYPEKQCTQVYGQALHDYLRGVKKPGIVMRRRAEARKKSNKPMRTKALDEALRWVGTKESPPHSNKVIFSDWYGLRGPWCAMFVTWCYDKAGSKSTNPKQARWAYCPFMVNDARAQRNGLIVVPTNKVEPGDIAMFDWRGNGISDHTGIVRTRPNNMGAFTCVEGNTSLDNNSDGGAVMVRNRNTRSVQVFIRVVR